jgi:hypothetical protein
MGGRRPFGTRTRRPSRPHRSRWLWIGTATERWRPLKTFDTDVERIVRSAQVDDDAVVLMADAGDLDLLADALPGESNHETNAKRRRALDEISEIVEGAIPGH